MTSSFINRGYQFWFCFIVAVVVIGTIYLFKDNHWVKEDTIIFGLKHDRSQVNASNKMALPDIVFNEHIYSESDFKNERGVVPTFWKESVYCSENSPNPKSSSCRPVWGPCYPPENNDNKNEWNHDLIEKYSKSIVYYQKDSPGQLKRQRNKLDNMCRPGFLIIGQGKCGTSSLYHYLAKHPRVLPASEKQIHYFKYYSHLGMRWYLSHFPTTKSMLAHGGLMTGEASPGYLPYPDVVHKVERNLPNTKIICLGRHPLDRSYSSYRYNYIHPALDQLYRGKVKGAPKGRSDEYYIEHHLYSFEDMIRAELAQLRKCLEPGGIGEVGALEAFGNESWGLPIYQRRQKAGLPPLIDLDGQCYGDFINSTVPKIQWNDLVRQKPGKFLNVHNLHLSQAMIGRSLYVYPLEWWYEMFPEDDLYFLCTEEMKDLSGEPINGVAQFLGLPSYNFSQVVQAGAYNVGGHKGYDKVTSWDEIEENEPTEVFNRNFTTTSNDSANPGKNELDSIPLSNELKTELMEFLNFHNERLFKLIGRRCEWD